MSTSLQQLLDQFKAAHDAGKQQDTTALYKAAGAAAVMAKESDDQQLLEIVALLGIGEYMKAIALIASRATGTSAKTDDDPLGDITGDASSDAKKDDDGDKTKVDDPNPTPPGGTKTTGSRAGRG